MTQVGKLDSLSDEEIIELYKENDADFKKKYESDQPGLSSYGNYYTLESPLDISVVELHTDSTGNKTIKELLAMYEISSAMSSIDANTGMPGHIGEHLSWKIWFSNPTDKAFQIYDKYYGGFRIQEQSNSDMWLVMRVNNPNDYVFALDEVGTEGTEAH